MASIAARKARTKKSDSDGVESKSKANVPLGPPASPDSLKFTEEAGAVPRNVLLDYLNTCTAMLLNEDNLRMCVEISLGGTGLHETLMEFQKQVMENNFFIERSFGCKYMSMIPKNHPDDTELHASAKRFMFICMRAYTKAIKLRLKENYEGKEPISSGDLERHQMVEFFETCNALMSMPEVKKALKEKFLTSGEPPAEDVMELQRGVFRDLNCDVAWATGQMDQIPVRYGRDADVINKMQQFQVAAELACKEAAMTDDERKKFYEQIPSFMHHFPHMFLWQQRLVLYCAELNRAELFLRFLCSFSVVVMQTSDDDAAAADAHAAARRADGS